jgi:hypothetical protein
MGPGSAPCKACGRVGKPSFHRKLAQNPSLIRDGFLYPLRKAGIDSPQMNAPTELSHDEMLGIKLEVLRREHRDLDQAIHALEETGRPDVLTLRRLKKQKLFLKDQIVKIEDMLIPDIIA